MAIFLPTKIKGDIVIYSKWCVQCLYPDLLGKVDTYATSKDLNLQIIRTAYRPADHSKATELWSCRDGAPNDETEEDAADYPTFVLYGDKIYKLKEFVKMISDHAKNKMVKEGKAKDDVQGLPKAKRAKRKNSVASTANEIKEETQGQING